MNCRIALGAVALLLLAGCLSTSRQPISQRSYTDHNESSPGWVDQRIEKNRELARQFPGEAKYHERIADLYWFERRDHKKALEHLEKAQKIDPANHRYSLLQARIYYALGSFRHAEDTYVGLVKTVGTDFTGPAYELAWLYMVEERFDDAEKSFLECLEIDPELAGAYYGLGKIAETRRDTERAVELLEKYLRLGGGTRTADALRTLRRLQPELGQR